MHKPDQGDYDSMEEVFKDRAGAALYRKEMLNDFGLFDEDFFLYLEDVYVAYGAQMTGWKFIYLIGPGRSTIMAQRRGVKSDLTTY